MQFVQSSVYDTGLPDDSYDFAIVRLLFLHLNDPQEAVREIYIDGIFGAVNPDIPSLTSVLRKVAEQQATKGGNRIIGRSLPRLLTRAGFSDVDMDIVIQHSNFHGIEGFKRQFDINRFVPFLRNGVINEQEYNELKQAHENINNSHEAYAMMTFVMACGKKV